MMTLIRATFTGGNDSSSHRDRSNSCGSFISGDGDGRDEHARGGSVSGDPGPSAPSAATIAASMAAAQKTPAAAKLWPRGIAHGAVRSSSATTRMNSDTDEVVDTPALSTFRQTEHHTRFSYHQRPISNETTSSGPKERLAESDTIPTHVFASRSSSHRLPSGNTSRGG